MGMGSDTASTPTSGREPDEAAVLDYLLRHPDFLMEHPDVLLRATPPRRFEQTDGKVVDIQHVMLKRLQTEMADLQDCAEELIMTTRSNMATQKGTLQAALAVLEAPGLAGLARVIGDELPMLLDVDACAVRLEPLAGASLLKDDDPAPGLLDSLPVGLIDELFGTDGQAILRPQTEAEPLFYGDMAPLIASDALVRLNLGPGQPPALLAVGSRLEGTFEPDMAMDLLVFLTRVLEHTVRRWLTEAR
ncbi:DUF484 family protein [Pararhodospirillum oryzae]|uniref:DUF484 domain-containing protein n=1 Tax=Pararhodospirillum oryzae TaxID=478448 RepID=A0A512H9Y6_9PROT|nr:DUF484 family protein [Pararhodospirillum oryzae]GEO82238.1 hypothetical protein ROR02_23690 [Pararhodospirillum oryzae]